MMTNEKNAPRLETPGKVAPYLLEPPQEKNFKSHLEFHLFENGTRPNGQPGLPGEPWTKDTFAVAMAKERRGGRGDARRSLDNWLRGKRCEDTPWGLAVENALFGKMRENQGYDQWRVLFRNARRAKPQEGHRSELYIREPLPLSVRHAILKQISAGLVQDGWRLCPMERGHGCTHPAFNRELVISPPVIRLLPPQPRWLAREHYPDDLRIFALADARGKGGDLNNDKKIRLASDFIGKAAVAIQETDYYSSVMTDQLAWDRVRSKRISEDGIHPERILWDGISAFIEENRVNRELKLMGFGQARISNQLGGSTLAFSSDGHLMIVYQSEKNLQSQFLLAPSGSGSLDWVDVAASNEADLLSLVRYGAERELREECALNTDRKGREEIRSKVMLIGFARMLHRAGKPEFFCLGRIAAPVRKIMERRRERYVERVLSANFEPANLHAGQIRGEIIRVCEDYLYRSSPRSGTEVSLSYPLEHALKLLIELCEDNQTAAKLECFMRDEF